MNDKLYSEYGNAGHKFPRTIKEAFGREELLFCAEEDEEVMPEFDFELHFGILVYFLAAIVVVLLWWQP